MTVPAFLFRVNALEGGKLFEHMPGQCAMLCVPGVSEGMFSITSSPTNKEYQEFSIKKCGSLTETLHIFCIVFMTGTFAHAFSPPSFSNALITFTIFRADGHFSTQRPQPTQEYMPLLFAGKYTSLCIKR